MILSIIKSVDEFSKAAFTYYVITEVERGVSEMFTHDYGRGGDDWPYDDISKNNFFHKMSMSWSLKK